MKLLTICTGLPGSGKSTWANAQPGAVVVNKDDIRIAMGSSLGDDYVYSHENEDEVLRRHDAMIIAALSDKDPANANLHIISDNTNFGKHRKRLITMAEKYGAAFVVRFFDATPEVCIERDALRGKASVGADVIWKFAERYQGYTRPLPTFAKYENDRTKPMAIICDLDGTLSLFKEKGHRGPYDQSNCDEDECNYKVRRLLELYYRHMDYSIVYLSGREEKFRPQTEKFLRHNHCPPASQLLMRATGDNRKDWIIKGELFDKCIRNLYSVDFVLDDRDQVVKFWRSIGLTCLQVADGEF